LFATAGAVHAQVSSASLGDPNAKRNLIRLLDFPDTEGDATELLECQSILKSNGKMKDASCYLKNNWDADFAEAVQKASKKAVLVPAHIGKTAKDIALMFQVEFLKKGDEKSINIYLNPGDPEMVQEYGKDHVSAQRIMGRENWQNECPKHSKWVVLAKAFISEAGVASSVDLAHGGGITPTGPCLKAIVKTVTSSTFAPATVDGVPVPSGYTEPFGN